MFNSRIVDEDDIPDGAIYLFWKNVQVAQYNTKLIGAMPGRHVDCTAVDLARGQNANDVQAQRMVERAKTDPKLMEDCRLPNNIRFKEQCRYMVTVNINTGDGIVNGAVGLCKYFEEKLILDDESIPPVRKVYFDFGDENIGKKTREKAKTKDKYKADKHQLNSKWTPIEFYQHVLYTSMVKEYKFKILRFQYPIVESEAQTIHKSQGQTYVVVAISINSDQQHVRDRFYVACSRVTSLKGLYFFGGETILTKKYLNMSDEQKKEYIEHFKKHDEVQIEMKRLRSDEYLFIPRYKFMNSEYVPSNERSSHKCITVMFQNIQNFTDLKKLILQSDVGFQNADIVHLCSTCLSVNHRTMIRLNNYRLVNETTGPHQDYMRTHSFGTLTYMHEVKYSDGMDLRRVYTNAYIDEYNQEDPLKRVEINIFKCSTRNRYKLFLAFVYIHPQTSITEFVKQFGEALTAIRQEYTHNDFQHNGLIVMGDFNHDFRNEPRNKNILEQNFGITPLTDTIGLTNINAGQRLIDWIFSNCPTNIIKKTGYVYETFISDHLPLFLDIKFLARN
jgi:hypothetical protein